MARRAHQPDAGAIARVVAGVGAVDALGKLYAALLADGAQLRDQLQAEGLPACAVVLAQFPANRHSFIMQTENQAEFSGWARVEVMGHQTHIGFVSTQVFGTAVMFRVDQPAIPGGEEALVRPEWVGDSYAAPGSLVKRADIEAATVLVGAGSIYRIIPCDEAAAMKAIRSNVKPPLMLVRLVDPSPLLSAGSRFGFEESEEDAEELV